MRTAIQLMEERLALRVRMPDVAAAVGLSVTQLGRLFRLDTGETPGAFLHGLRIARARLLVERTTLPVADIMRCVGIADRSHFARDFKRKYGMSPRFLRVQLQRAGLRHMHRG